MKNRKENKASDAKNPEVSKHAEDTQQKEIIQEPTGSIWKILGFLCLAAGAIYGLDLLDGWRYPRRQGFTG